MDASVDANVFIHLYQSNQKDLLFTSFDRLYIFEYIVDVEIKKNASKVFQEVQEDITAGRLVRIGFYDLIQKGIKNLFHKIYACRLAGGMSLSLKSGLPFDRCIELSKELIYDKHFQKEINDCQNLLDEGSSLAKSFHDSHIFTGVQARMLNIAEKAGQVDSIMDDIANQLEGEIDEKISSYINILEPTLVIILSIIVGVILLSVMLPLLGIMSNI